MTAGREVLLSPLPGVLRQAAVQRVLAGLAQGEQRVIVPNVQAGLDFGRAAGLQASCITLTQLARDLLGKAGWTVLKPGEVARFLEEALQDVSFEYLESICEQRSTLSVLVKLIAELERDHIDPAELLRVCAPGREKDVAAAYQAYHTACLRLRRYDAAGAEHFAALLPELPALPAVVHGYSYLDPAQRELIGRLLAPGAVVTLPACEGATTTRTQESVDWLRQAGFTLTEVVPAAEDGALSRGDEVTWAYWSGEAAEMTLAEYPDTDAEVRACLRTVRAWLAQGVPPERVALVIRREETYLETLSDVAAEYHVPLVSGAQRPLSQTGLGSLLQAWVDAQRAGWNFATTQALLTHPLLTLPFDAADRVRALRPYSPRGLFAWSAELQWLALPEKTTWRDALQGTVQRLLTEFGVHDRCRREPTLNTALTLFLDRLRSEARRGEACTAQGVLSAVSHVLRDVHLPALLGKAAVRVVNPLAAQGRDFDRVWVLGLADTIFPAVRSDHPLIDAHIRQRWGRFGVDVPDYSRLTSVEEALFLGAIGIARDTLVLSRPLRYPGGQPLPPSPYWTRLRASANPGTTEPNTDSAPGRALTASPPPASALEEAVERALAGDLRQDRPASVAGGAHTAGCQTASRQIASYQSAGHPLLPAGLSVLDVSRRSWTLPELRTALTCRYRWWHEYVLGAVPPATQDFDSLREEALHCADMYLSAFPAADDEDLARTVHWALEQVTREKYALDEWRFTSLWPVHELEIAQQLCRVLSHPDFRPAGWQAMRSGESRPYTLGAHTYRYAVTLPESRLDQTPQGLGLTVYRRQTQTSGALEPDLQLALQLSAAGAVSGRYLCTATGQAYGTLRHVPRPGRDSPITRLREELARLGDALAAGQIAPPPDLDSRSCQTCPVGHTCQLRPSEAA